MTQERLSVRKIREILRLKNEIGLSNRVIARACQVSNSTVGEYMARAKQAGLKWPLPEDASEEELYRKLFPEGEKPKVTERPIPNWEEIHRDLARQGVTLRLLWQEYRVKYPNGYGRSQFQELYQRWNRDHAISMRLPHKGGEVLEVDYAGMRVPITNPETGEVTPAQVFVAVLPASSYTYAEIQPSQELQHWLSGHVHAFTFLGGTPKIIRPDNLKSGVRKPNYYEPDLNPSYQELAEHYHVAFEGHYYSVPHTLVGQEVRMRATEHMLEIFHRGQQVAIHPLSAVQGRFSTCPDHMPSNHRFVLELDAGWLLKQAEAIGPFTTQYLKSLLKSRTFPEQAYRSCLGVLSLARKYPQPLMETACEQACEAHLSSSKALKAELEALSQHTPVLIPQIVHENIRGETYYN